MWLQQLPNSLFPRNVELWLDGLDGYIDRKTKEAYTTTDVTKGDDKAGGTSMVFNGTTSHIDTGNTYQATMRDSFSISMWIRPDDGQPDSDNLAFGVDDTTGDDSRFQIGILGGANTGKLTVYYESEGDVASALTAAAVFIDGQETWHHIVGVVTETSATTVTVTSYLDGVLAKTGTTATSTMNDWTATRTFFVGALNKGSVIGPFAGDIANVILFNKALTAEEVGQMYNKHK